MTKQAAIVQHYTGHHEALTLREFIARRYETDDVSPVAGLDPEDAKLFPGFIYPGNLYLVQEHTHFWFCDNDAGKLVECNTHYGAERALYRLYMAGHVEPLTVELRNVKHAAFASQETACFEAALYINGKRAGTVGNDGNGGPNSYSDHGVEERLDSYAATLPPKLWKYTIDGEQRETTIEQGADTLIDAALDTALRTKDLQRALRTSVMFVGTDGKLYRVKPRKGATVAALLAPQHRAALVARHGIATILNELPFDKALDIYAANTGDAQ
jgi:hypothetical protein